MSNNKRKRLDYFIKLKGKSPWTVDGHDNAILGVVELASGEIRVAYSTKAIIKNLVADGMSMYEALEYFDFNIEGSYLGDGTPLFVEDRF